MFTDGFIETSQLLPGPISVGKFTFKNKDELFGFDENIGLAISMSIGVVEREPLTLNDVTVKLVAFLVVPQGPSNMSFISHPRRSAAPKPRALR